MFQFSTKHIEFCNFIFTIDETDACYNFSNRCLGDKFFLRYCSKWLSIEFKKNLRRLTGKIRQEYDFIEYKYTSFIFDVQSLVCSIYLSSSYLNNFLPSFQLYPFQIQLSSDRKGTKKFPRETEISSSLLLWCLSIMFLALPCLTRV